MFGYPAFEFVSGLIMMGYIIAGLFFFRFWKRTRDGLFGAFALAFWLLALNQGIVAESGLPREELSWVYLLRFTAFLLIIAATVRKNLSGANTNGRLKRSVKKGNANAP